MATFETFLCVISQIADAVYSINGVPGACELSYFKWSEVTLLKPFEKVVENARFRFENMEIDEEIDTERLESSCSPFEDDFE